MFNRQQNTAVRNRRAPSKRRPRTGTIPQITSVAAVSGEVNQINIVFDQGVVIGGTPPWNATVGGNPVAPVGVVTKTLQNIVLDYGQDVSTATSVTVPQTEENARSATGQLVQPGVYPLS